MPASSHTACMQIQVLNSEWVKCILNLEWAPGPIARSVEILIADPVVVSRPQPGEIFYGISLTSPDSRKVAVSNKRKYVHEVLLTA